jgi:signal transduction histidine kinase
MPHPAGYHLRWIDKGLLFACCLGVFLAWFLSAGTLAPEAVSVMLAAIIVSGLLSLAETEKYRIVLTTGYALVCCFVPTLTFFLPLMAYDMPGGEKSFGDRFDGGRSGGGRSGGGVSGGGSSGGGSSGGALQWVNLVALMPLVLFCVNHAALTAVAVCALVPLAVVLRLRRIAYEALSLTHRQLRDANRETQDRLRRHNRELLDQQEMERHAATLAERNRIAREIHDSVGHQLSSALLQVGALQVGVRNGAGEDNASPLQNGLSTLKETLAEAMNRIRESVHDLRDESVDLHAQLRAMAGQFTFCPLRLDDGWGEDVEMAVKTMTLAVCREALTNIMKHSDATAATITLREHPAFRQLMISDNGTVKAYHMEDGMGLSSMETRVRALGGQFRVSVASGFEIFISIPKEAYRAHTGGG